MAQFDVYLNPMPDSRQSVPYVLDVQSALLDTLPTRLVMPLSRLGVGTVRLPGNLCPTVDVAGETLILLAHLAAPIPAKLLRKPVFSIPQRTSDVNAAFDAVLSGV